MKRFILLAMLAFLFLGLGLLISCHSGKSKSDDDSSGDDDAADDDASDDDAADDDAADDDSGDVWTDPDTGLMWQNGSGVLATTYHWQGAKDYCDNLSWGGHSDWRLPDINELRSLIRGCSGTVTGGACAVTDSCLNFTGCWDQPCTGCTQFAGPGTGGAYWPTNIIGDIGWYWSSSEQADSPVDHPFAWSIIFDDGGISQGDGIDIDNSMARCVR